MSRTCEICGKGGRAGTSIVRHGMPKKKGGIGLHTTGITRRRFLANELPLELVLALGHPFMRLSDRRAIGMRLLDFLDEPLHLATRR